MKYRLLAFLSIAGAGLLWQGAAMASTCQTNFSGCSQACIAAGSDMDGCIGQCGIVLESCVSDRCAGECTDTYAYCTESCPEDVIEQKRTCETACEVAHTDAEGNTNHSAYASCYGQCGAEYPECPHGPLCKAADQEIYDSCHGGCINAYNAGDKTDADLDQFGTCTSACITQSPYCEHDNWSTTIGTTDGQTTVTTTSTSTTTTPTDVSTDGTSTSTSTSTSTTGTDTGGTSTTTNTSSTSGGTGQNYCRELYGDCGDVCDDTYIVNGLISDAAGYDTCNGTCADTYQACLGAPVPGCSEQLNGCYDTCETQHDFVPENCAVFADEASTYACQVRNADGTEAAYTSRGRCVGACRQEFSQCLEPTRWFPKRPDLGPNTCTEIPLTRSALPDQGTLKQYGLGGPLGNDDFTRLLRIPFMGPLSDEMITRYGASSLITDVRVSDIAYTPFVSLMQQGVLRGYEDGTVRPDQVITRAELFKVIAYANEETVLSNCSNYYADVEPGSWYDPYVRLAHDEGYVYATGNLAQPAGLIKFENFVLISARAFGLADGAGDDFIGFRDRLNGKNLLPLWLKDETDGARWITRRDMAEVIYRYTVMLDGNTNDYAEQLYLTIPDFGIQRMPLNRALLSTASSWLPASLDGGAYYTDVREGREGTPILFGHASFKDETEPALTVFREVSQQMVVGQVLELERRGERQVYAVSERTIVSGLDVNALADYGEADAVFFTCNVNPWERVLLKLERVE